MLKKKSLILMLLFSLLAHLAIAGSLIYAPLRFPGNNRVIGAEKVIWGVMQIQGAGGNGRRDRPSGLSIERVAGKKRETEVGGKESEVRSEILMSLRGRKEHENGQEQEIQAPDFSLDREIRLKPNTQQGFSNETIMSQRDTKDNENVIPAEAGIQNEGRSLDSHFRGNDVRKATFSGEDIETGRQEREIDGRSDPEGLFSHQETFQTGMNGGCNGSNNCTDIWVSGNQTFGADKIIAYSGKSGRDHLRGILEKVRKEIERHKYYPPFARRNGIEGTVYMNFRIGSDGKPGSISVGRSSGFKILDDSATKTLKDIRQFPTVPEGMKRLDITVPIAYRLTEEKN